MLRATSSARDDACIAVGTVFAGGSVTYFGQAVL